MKGDWRCHWCGYRLMKSVGRPTTLNCPSCRGDFPWENEAALSGGSPADAA